MRSGEKSEKSFLGRRIKKMFRHSRVVRRRVREIMESRPGCNFNPIFEIYKTLKVVTGRPKSKMTTVGQEGKDISFVFVFGTCVTRMSVPNRECPPNGLPEGNVHRRTDESV